MDPGEALLAALFHRGQRGRRQIHAHRPAAARLQVRFRRSAGRPCRRAASIAPAGPIDFSLLTDGLRAEREQGITIDVAYRYFETPRRKFIIADTPGHEQYTRNMATGASTAEAAVILMDATKGVLRQTRRHAYIAHLLGVQHIVAAVNKMDLVGFSQEVFDRISAEFRRVRRSSRDSQCVCRAGQRARRRQRSAAQQTHAVV